MKNNIYIAFVVIFLIINAGCDSAPSPQEQAAVESVWDQFMKAQLKSFEEFNTKGENRIDPWTRSRMVEIQHNRNIDVSRCPKSFRAAWSEYMTALQADNPVAFKELNKDDGLDYALKLIEAHRPLQEAKTKLSEEFEKYSPKIAYEFAKNREYEEAQKQKK